MIKQRWRCPVDNQNTYTISNSIIRELFCTQHGVRRVNESTEKVL